MRACKWRKEVAISRSHFGKYSLRYSRVAATPSMWNTQVAAIAVTVADETEDGKAVLRPDNVFLHVTIWCQDGASPFQSNSLPGLVETGEAHRIELLDPVIFDGTISLWPLGKH